MMSFLLPSDAAPSNLAELTKTCIAGGYDNMPTPTRVQLQSGRLVVEREISESGFLMAPWDVDGVGRIMCTTATLIERAEPYLLSVELARGKINQLRCQLADWRMAGLQVPEAVEQQIREASHWFGQAVTATEAGVGDGHARAALAAGVKAANQLVRVYIDQMLRARRQRQPRLETSLGVRFNSPMPPAAADEVAAALNSAIIPLVWRTIEPSESQYRWDLADAMCDWATKRRLRLSAGPLIDFSAYGLPDWLWLWENDLPALSSFMRDYVETVVGRYHRRIRRWQLTAGSNVGQVLKLGEDDLLWLTAQLAEAAWQVDPELELIVGIAQPWGEYMAREEHTYSPFVFADTLIRAGLKLAALELEWVMGVAPRGSYCRDLLDASRLLDLYALLGVPVQVTMAYPSERLNATQFSGDWLSGLTPDGQADWAADFLALAACKPFVRAVNWAQLNDAETPQFPHVGLLDSAGAAKTVVSELRHFRDEHLQ